MGVLSLRMYGAMGQIVICRIVTGCALSVANWFMVVVCHIYIARRGQALRCLSLRRGNARA